MKRIWVFALAMLATGAAYAGPSAVVPEIDSVAGLAALSAVGATVALIWERRRRRTK